jgi:hypothetical protein
MSMNVDGNIIQTRISRAGRRRVLCEQSTNRREGDVERVENLRVRAVLARECLTLHHVDKEVDADYGSETTLPCGGVKNLLHAELARKSR